MKKYEVIREFFGKGNRGRKVELAELKALTSEEREEMAELAANAMGLKKQPNGEYV